MFFSGFDSLKMFLDNVWQNGEKLELLIGRSENVEASVSTVAGAGMPSLGKLQLDSGQFYKRVRQSE